MEWTAISALRLNYTVATKFIIRANYSQSIDRIFLIRVKSKVGRNQFYFGEACAEEL